MFKGKRSRVDNVASVASAITRSGALTDEESEAAVSSPQFFSALLAGLDSERHRGQAVRVRIIAATVVPGKMKMAFSALMIVAAVTFWLFRIPALARRNVNVSRPEPSPALNACSLSATSACAITTGDVLQLVISDNLQEVPK